MDWNCGKETPFNALVGETINLFAMNEDEDEIRIETRSGKKYVMGHVQDCCEVVTVEDICGEIGDVVGSPVLFAEESSEHKEDYDDYTDESKTWTFYRLGTAKGTIVIRWYGTSNGYYSEAVELYEVI